MSGRSDTVGSLSLSQRLLGTVDVLLVRHTDCGLEKVSEDDFLDELEQEAGRRPPWRVQSFTDVGENVRRSIARVRQSPFLTGTEVVRGFVYEVATGRLREVAPDFPREGD